MTEFVSADVWLPAAHTQLMVKSNAGFQIKGDFER